VRRGTDGDLTVGPLATGIESTRALAAWCEADKVIAAHGAGSNYVNDGMLRRWDLTEGEPYGPPIDAHLVCVDGVALVTLPGGEALVTFGPGERLRLWRPNDGALLAETLTNVRSKVTGFAAEVVEGRPYVVLTSLSQPMTVYALDDLTAQPITITKARNDVALAVVGPHVVAAHFDYERSRPNTVHVWHFSGRRIGPDILGETEVTAAAGQVWPAVFIGRADGTVSLIDVKSGRDLCPPMLLPTRPNTMTTTANGDLVVGFGSDVARVRPPIADPTL
jgi:hypothetical protein